MYSGLEELSKYIENNRNQDSSCERRKIQIQVRERPNESRGVGTGPGRVRMTSWFKIYILNSIYLNISIVCGIYLYSADNRSVEHDGIIKDIFNITCGSDNSLYHD